MIELNEGEVESAYHFLVVPQTPTATAVAVSRQSTEDTRYNINTMLILIDGYNAAHKIPSVCKFICLKNDTYIDR